ncbi:cysteine--tRNA ligase [Patescibacteria group bacterium]|nr:cysteine--tRNA ligase [Patescibacteria group bacterium]
MPIRLYNTLSRTKEVFKPLHKKKVGFYACGPTVYWHAHLGNLRTYIFEDILRRALEYNGYKVKHVMNFTDVGHLTSDDDIGEDKMEKGARRESKTVKEIAAFYIAAFKNDLRALNIEKPTIFAKATEHIKEQINLVKILEKKDFTYKITDGIYFDTAKLPDYGRLARLKLEGQRAGARVAQAEGKKNPADFAVWKFAPKGTKRQQEWNSPWGKGFPGWHLECSAMSQKYLGEQFDIHAGANDLIPIHHTNEIAQSQAAYGCIPAHYWLHGEFLLIDGNKMAKSLENFMTLEKTSERFNPLAFRYLTLTAHYRSQLNLTWDSMEAAQIALNNLSDKMRELAMAPAHDWWLAKLTLALGLANKEKQKISKKIKKYQEDFLQAVNDDLDMPKALSIIWPMMEDAAICAPAKKELLLEFDKVLGLGLSDIKSTETPAEIQKLVRQREQFRQQKHFIQADVIRARIEKAGWLIEDTNEGPKIKRKN